MKKKIIIATLTGVIVGFAWAYNTAEKEILKAYDQSEKNRFLYRTAVQWLNKEKCGEYIGDFIRKSGYNSVAVFGLSYLGKVLVELLESQHISVKYGIDNGTVSSNYDIPIFTSSDELPDVDVIIVTPIYSYDTIRNELSKKITSPIISLADIVFEG